MRVAGRHVALSALVAGAATAVALASAWHSGGHVWRELGAQRVVYGGYSDVQRERAPLAQIPLPTGIFDFFRENVRPGDRVYFQVRKAPFSDFFTLPQIISAAGRYDLLPARQVTDLRDATVVVSWLADPKRLPARFVSHARYGLRSIYVSRIAEP
jgi:hypothetical protein